jgi:ATP-dependent protease HslVU (ClpYQ) peptidase subunit
MGENFEKTMAILNGSKGMAATAIKAMALDLDKKFEELEKKNDERHNALMSAIRENKADTDRKFEKLRVVMFFAESPKWLVISIAGIVFVLMMAGFGDFLKLIK